MFISVISNLSRQTKASHLGTNALVSYNTFSLSLENSFP